MKRPLITILTAAFLSLMLLTANVYWRQKVQFDEGEAGNRAGNFMVALTGYESAIRMYLPFASRVELSAQRIWALAETAEGKGDTGRALAAYRSLRSAFYAVGCLWQPGEEWISRCDTKIAVLAPVRRGNKP